MHGYKWPINCTRTRTKEATNQRTELETKRLVCVLEDETYGCGRTSSVMRASKNVGNYQSCMVSKLPMIGKQTVVCCVSHRFQGLSETPSRACRDAFAVGSPRSQHRALPPIPLRIHVKNLETIHDSDLHTFVTIS